MAGKAAFATPDSTRQAFACTGFDAGSVGKLTLPLVALPVIMRVLKGFEVVIYDKVENFERYFREGEKLYRALEFARDFDVSEGDGKYEIEGEEIFAMVMSYETRGVGELEFETHRKYIDVQLLPAGRELLDVSLSEEMECSEEYSAEKDAALWRGGEDYSSLHLEPGRFAVLYPWDVHRPGRSVAGPEKVRKMVVKVLI